MLTCLSGLLALSTIPAFAHDTVVLVVSRERVLREVKAARLIREAEQALTAKFQAEVDRTKLALAEEELALTEQRASLSKEEFSARVARFDRRMRAARQQTQERVSALQLAFQRARQQVVDALPGVLEAVRRRHGATLIVNSDQVLAAIPDNDVTDEVIAHYDSTVPAPDVPVFDGTSLLLDLPGDSE